MVDVGEKAETAREAVAVAEVRMSRPTVALVFAGPRRRRAGRRPTTEPRPTVATTLANGLAKGDALATARLAAISAVKRTSELIPLCHPVRVVGTDVELRPLPRLPGLRIEVRVRAFDRTGVEMEAMVGAAAAALTVYDMVKGVERGVEITSVRLELKRGGRTGLWTRPAMTARGAPRETKPAPRASRIRASRKPVPTP
jgi:cyclic pyranopterin phosphate synthase